MVNQDARNRYFQESRMKTLIDGLGKTLSSALSSKDVIQKDDGGYSLNVKFKEEPNTETVGSLDKIGKALVMIFNQLKGFKITLPKIFKVEGSVDVDSVADMPPLEIKNFKDIAPYFKVLEEKLGKLASAISMVGTQKIEFPKMDFPKTDLTGVVEELRTVQDYLKEASGKNIKFPKSISVDNFPVQLTPQPVTNININGLRGPVLSTAITVTNSPTLLPTTALVNRRSMVVFNNSSQTVYLGGSTVTTSNGLPILTQTYSPAIDLSAIVSLYGIVASSTADVRVLEASMDATGS